ncbi:MAG: CRISPR-associated helicase Cas3' [Rhizobiaceae bacterium]|nr:CRISPR-associated helicase Cas3' [Rhizobiaceae bacterium]
MAGLNASAEGYWAKRRPRNAPTDWHPLRDHCHDVAAVFEALLALPAIESRLAGLAGGTGLSALWKTRLTVLAFLHDFGKANHKFQRGEGGHIHEAAAVVLNDDLCRAAHLDVLDGWTASSREGLRVMAAVLAHHGYAADFPADHAEKMRRHWQEEAGRTPLGEVAALVGEAERCWPEAFAPGGEPLPQAPAFWHGFLGLLQLADWLGSDDSPDAFPYAREADRPRRDFAQDVASTLLAPLGLDVSALRAGRAIPDFSAISPFEPSPIQRAVGEAAGRLVTLEAETGSGKTEAALYRLARLFMAGRVDGLYLALPTRVAASQMFGRVRDCVARLFPDPSMRPAVVRALPGDAGADGARVSRRPEPAGPGGRSLPSFEVQWDDDPGEAERRRRWAAEQPKRFLAATVAVGTIDQALLGAVRVKHAQMRAFCLSRSLLVVDEVHASDAYMTRLLGNLLDQHYRAGGEALLLSATLGAAARTELMLGPVVRRGQLKKHLPAYAQAVAMPYPCFSVLDGARIVTTGAPSRGTGKTVALEAVQAIAEPQRVADIALSAARRGARVLVIRNTVGDAVATRQALEALAPGDPVQFTLAERPTLHHGRFAREDRRLLDAEVEARLGNTAERNGGLVVVGTQTLEISLDIDADLLITDLAPVDVLLQRIGRLHRHDRTRPAGFEVPSCRVLVPADFDAALATVKRERMSGPHGLGSVYASLPVLAATLRLIGAGATWRIPAMNRELVEAATHPDRLDALVDELSSTDPRWHDVKVRGEGRETAETQTAEGSRLRWDEPILGFSIDENAATRLGARNVELHFDPPLTGPFGKPVTRLVVPQHLNLGGALEADGVTPIKNGFTFGLQEKMLVYDALGLRGMP